MIRLINPDEVRSIVIDGTEFKYKAMTWAQDLEYTNIIVRSKEVGDNLVISEEDRPKIERILCECVVSIDHELPKEKVIPAMHVGDVFSLLNAIREASKPSEADEKN